MPSRVFPEDSRGLKAAPEPSRARNVLKWLTVMAGFPLTYIILPVSCCVRNPAVYACGDEAYLKEPIGPASKCVENVMVGCNGAATLLCCCGCFCGGCGVTTTFCGFLDDQL